MNEMFRQSLFAGVTISLIAYEIGLFLKRKLGLAILNPLLVSIVIVILALKVFGISYEVYNASAKYISYLLTPATVCLAVPLYEQLELLKKNKVAVVCGILSGTLASLTGIFVLCMLFGFNHQQYVTMLPKSITTAIGNWNIRRIRWNRDNYSCSDHYYWNSWKCDRRYSIPYL